MDSETGGWEYVDQISDLVEDARNGHLSVPEFLETVEEIASLGLGRTAPYPGT